MSQGLTVRVLLAWIGHVSLRLRGDLSGLRVRTVALTVGVAFSACLRRCRKQGEDHAECQKQDKIRLFISISFLSQHEIYCVFPNYSTGAECIQGINWKETMQKSRRKCIFLHGGSPVSVFSVPRAAHKLTSC